MSEAQSFITGESDPNDFKVDQVTAHLATASSEEVERVRELESAGQGRKGILTADTEAMAVGAFEDANSDPDRPKPGDRIVQLDGIERVVVSS